MIISNHIKGIFSATFAALCWGTALVMSKGALESYPPILLLLIQLASSVVFIWSIILFKKIKIPNLRTLTKVSMFGLLEPFLAYMLILIGLTYSRATDAALLQSLESIFILILAAILFKEKVSTLFVILSLIIIIGLYLSIGGSLSNVVNADITGTVLIIIGMLTAAIYVVMTSRSIASADTIVIVACQQSIALLATVFVFIGEYTFTNYVFPTPSYSTVIIAIISGIFQYALAFTFYLTALKHISAGLSGMFLNLVPIFGISGAYLFLGEKMVSVQVVGSAITIFSLILMSLLSNKKNNTKI
ncbi:DMT family transporter (plasmid) [Xenorhabdus stockiae]|uniref:DMT family transporter n=1 Tax=Xenorhabdus stockiae TaxID=351614 RepID=UPI003CF4522C